MNTKQALEKWPNFTVREVFSLDDLFLLDTLAASTTVPRKLREAARRRSQKLQRARRETYEDSLAQRAKTLQRWLKKRREVR